MLSAQALAVAPVRDGMRELHVYGVRKCLVEITPQAVTLHRLMVDPEKQGNGYGSHAIEAVKEIARLHRLPILLTFAPDDGKDTELRRFYRRHGFSFLSDAATMRWKP